ncbi:MAG: glycosyltransferase [Leptolyngbyaceae cyanobacterium MAG.088]|nr:glycosyltransferase [Leptolyngbyaceae cyanobacterium MAG.088]
MNVLMLAPHPFYQARGTPIAVDLVLRVLSSHGEVVDLVTFAEGKDVDYPNVKIYRTPSFRFAQNIRPGFSWKKLLYDLFIFIKAIQLVRAGRYDLVHAGEEAVFIALFIKKAFGVPYVYDMDSSLVGQMVDRYPGLRFLKALLEAFEGAAVKNATAVIPVCRALATEVQRYSPSQKVVVIPDISLLNQPH